MSAEARALVVCCDDDAGVLAAIARTLRGLPVEVITTLVPQEALELVALREVAVLISDYEMPAMNGVDLVAAARRIRPETVRMLVTGYKTFDAAVEGINQGEVFRFIGKPFLPPDLRQSVLDAVARHRELAVSSAERERSTRRVRLAAELELEHPHLTEVVRERDGAYRVAPPDATLVAGLGLDAITALSRLRS